MPCQRCDAVITRNARLIVRLRHFAAAIHVYERHHPGVDWTHCTEPSCVAAQVTIEQPQAGPQDHQSRTPNNQHFGAIFKNGVVAT